ncbi:hypothetical protein SteCoe_34852 [Stentor coeruleus]|uniref:deoxyhypusine synthase n=1 Tax=Stentor coeruleus TaxID=5963 RepID=A0A1R2ATP2_9CILI|nr:hypothetical protein SteCoe_34852 [Stentor coeruleus]
MVEKAKEVIMMQSAEELSLPEIKGYDFNKGINYSELISSYLTTGLQATHLAKAIQIVNQMLKWRLSEDPLVIDDPIQDIKERAKVKCTVFLAYTSNMISCGVREIIRYLVQHKLVDVITTTGGGIEEDFIKCLAPTYLGDFNLKGLELRAQGLNRIGNMLVPNKNYCKFEQWIMPILDKILEEQRNGIVWTPSKFIHRLGLEINNEESVYYWAAVNNIPVLCPGITDGSIGDMLFMHSYNNGGLILDVINDVRVINDIAMVARKSGMIILGGGLPKHHTCNANMMRNGADYSIYINTGIEHEGSDSGAAPDEAVSWGKIKGSCEPVKVFSEASLVFPLLVAESFAKYHEEYFEDCQVCMKRKK